MKCEPNVVRIRLYLSSRSLIPAQLNFMPAKRKQSIKYTIGSLTDWRTHKDILSKVWSMSDLFNQFKRGLHFTHCQLRDIREDIAQTTLL